MKKAWPHTKKNTNVQLLEPGFKMRANSANSMIMVILTMIVTKAAVKHWLCAKHHARYFTYITCVPFNPFYRWEIWGSEKSVTYGHVTNKQGNQDSNAKPKVQHQWFFHWRCTSDSPSEIFKNTYAWGLTSRTFWLSKSGWSLGNNI